MVRLTIRGKIEHFIRVFLGDSISPEGHQKYNLVQKLNGSLNTVSHCDYLWSSVYSKFSTISYEIQLAKKRSDAQGDND